MQFITSFVSKTSSVKYIFCLFALSHFVLLLMMTYTFPRINEQIGTSAFDLQTFGYSVTEASTIVNNLNGEVTAFYLFPQLCLLDVLYPFLLALFLSSFLFRLIRLIGKNSAENSVLLMIPFLAMHFDYLENICIVLMITKSVDVSEYFVLLSSTSTVLKSAFTSFAWVGILYYSIMWFRMR